MDENKEDKRIHELTTLIGKLQIEQNNINKKLKDATSLLHEIKHKRKSNHTETKVYRKETRGAQPKTGDVVTIVNPKENQPSKGTVIGFTTTNFVKVRGGDGSIVRRIPRNLQIHKEV
jgi:alpha-acetolactate decarboxylase